MRDASAASSPWSVVNNPSPNESSNCPPDSRPLCRDCGFWTAECGLWTVDCEPPPPDSKPESFRGCVPALDYRAFLSLKNFQHVRDLLEQICDINRQLLRRQEKV